MSTPAVKMELSEVLAALEEVGTEQNRKIYRRHGVQNPMYGVSVAELKKLHKQIKRDHELAQALWATGNHDARQLAAMVADPAQATDAEAEAWVRDLGNYVVTDSLSGYVAQTALARAKMEQWTRSDDEWIGTAGWNLLTHLAMYDRDLPDSFFEPYLQVIERDIHSRKNRVRYAMNNALIAIGIRGGTLTDKATAVAQRIGLVEVDHGETSCKTPDAASYIAKALARRAGSGDTISVGDMQNVTGAAIGQGARATVITQNVQQHGATNVNLGQASDVRIGDQTEDTASSGKK
jgi:3-methyladenine DNA glycosylase AlkD